MGSSFDQLIIATASALIAGLLLYIIFPQPPPPNPPNSSNPPNPSTRRAIAVLGGISIFLGVYFFLRNNESGQTEQLPTPTPAPSVVVSPTSIPVPVDTATVSQPSIRTTEISPSSTPEPLPPTNTLIPPTLLPPPPQPTYTLLPTYTAYPIVPTPIPPQEESTPLSPTWTPFAPPEGPCVPNRIGDDINVNGSGPSQTADINTVLGILQPYEALPESAIRQLDRLFEENVCTGYQYRALIPAQIPSAQPAQRLMWSSLAWVDTLPPEQHDLMNSRIERIRCNGSNPCIWIIKDGAELSVGWPGRGLLLSRPLDPENDFSWWGSN
jgi:hypothetical protein